MPEPSSTPPILMPPRRTAADGSPRRVGVELEFADLDAAAAARLVRDLYGGTLETSDPHRCMVRGTRFGDFTVELDMRAAHPPEKDEPGALDAAMDWLRPLLGNVGSLVMPFEIAAPPVPMEALGELEGLVEGLRAQGAAGTEASPLFAFGLHYNIQVAEESGDYLLDHLKAYLVLAPWLRAEVRVDPTRRLSGFVAPFPEDYALRVLDPAYRPDLDGLIADHLAANPTRNRELDLFPLFAHLAPKRLFATVDDPHVRARPAFHYRLPNARLGDAGFSLAADWNRWVAVEELAADGERLARMAAAFRDAAARNALAGWPDDVATRLRAG